MLRQQPDAAADLEHSAWPQVGDARDCRVEPFLHMRLWNGPVVIAAVPTGEIRALPGGIIGRLEHTLPLPDRLVGLIATMQLLQFVRVWDDIADEPQLARRIVARRHDGVAHAVHRAESGGDLLQFDPEPAQLHLLVEAPDIFDEPVGPQPGEIAGAIETARRRPPRRLARNVRRSIAGDADSRAPGPLRRYEFRRPLRPEPH